VQLKSQKKNGAGGRIRTYGGMPVCKTGAIGLSAHARVMIGRVIFEQNILHYHKYYYMSEEIKSTCKMCNIIFYQRRRKIEYMKIFCSRSCSASYNNKNKIYKNNYKKQGICKYCNEKFIFKKKSSLGKFCSLKCTGEFTFQESIKKANDGLVSTPVTLKKILTYKEGYKCKICNLSNWNNKEISLHLDHIDGNSDNNFLPNLRLLCPNCHSQTETFSGRNIKNSKRSIYNKRYRKK